MCPGDLSEYKAFVFMVLLVVMMLLKVHFVSHLANWLRMLEQI